MSQKTNPVRVLIADDELELRSSLAAMVSSLGPYEPILAADGAEAIALLGEHEFRFLILDVNMPGASGLEVLREARATQPAATVLVATAHGRLADAVEAMRLGAFNYIEKPVSEEHLAALFRQAEQAHELVESVGFAQPTVLFDDGQEFVGRSSQMQSVFKIIHRLADVGTSVLIRGENGTGKELVARAIHFNSSRKEKRFVAVNCGAIPENLVESEFFGHEKGAFTGATERHIGKFQFAEGGTLFLDEIGDVSPQMQVKLLRVLQERKFTPVGSNREIKSDVRIVAATNQNLEKMVADGKFRQDLYYRLNVMPILLPALRDRVDDIPALVNRFIDKFNTLHGKRVPIRGIREDAMNVLRNYAWPGNIRELENAIERAFILESSQLITASSLPDYLRATPTIKAGPSVTVLDYQTQKESFEREFILSALRMFKGRINQTVAHAGIPKNTLLRKMKKYGIDPKAHGATDAELDDELGED